MAEKEYIERETAISSLDELEKTSYHNSVLWPDHVEECREALRSIPAADVRPVVTCADCKWWTKQESSLQGRCELLQMYPTGAWFCANGKREES